MLPQQPLYVLALGPDGDLAPASNFRVFSASIVWFVVSTGASSTALSMVRRLPPGGRKSSAQ